VTWRSLNRYRDIHRVVFARSRLRGCCGPAHIFLVNQGPDRQMTFLKSCHSHPPSRISLATRPLVLQRKWDARGQREQCILGPATGSRSRCNIPESGCALDDRHVDKMADKKASAVFNVKVGTVTSIQASWQTDRSCEATSLPVISEGRLPLCPCSTFLPSHALT
jgi:hypothetical protein